MRVGTLCALCLHRTLDRGRCRVLVKLSILGVTGKGVCNASIVSKA